MKANWPQPDFAARPARRPALAWWCGAAGILVAALSVNDWMTARHDLDKQRERLAHASQRALPLVARARTTASGVSVPEAEAILAAQRVVDRIEHPWDRILANVEAETPQGLQWLELDHDADEAALTLSGAAGDVRTVLQLVDNLSDRPGWSDVVIGRLRSADAREAAGVMPPWRFELRAQLDARALAQARPRGEH
jgi:hypothetical protein